MKKMRLVIDTNVLLVSIGRQSKYNWLFQAFLKEEFDLLVTTPILLEYHEKIALKTQPIIAENILKLILAKPNVVKVDISSGGKLSLKTQTITLSLIVLSQVMLII